MSDGQCNISRGITTAITTASVAATTAHEHSCKHIAHVDNNSGIKSSSSHAQMSCTSHAHAHTLKAYYTIGLAYQPGTIASLTVAGLASFDPEIAAEAASCRDRWVRYVPDPSALQAACARQAVTAAAVAASAAAADHVQHKTSAGGARPSNSKRQQLQWHGSSSSALFIVLCKQGLPIPDLMLDCRALLPPRSHRRPGPKQVAAAAAAAAKHTEAAATTTATAPAR